MVESRTVLDITENRSTLKSRAKMVVGRRRLSGGGEPLCYGLMR